MNLTLIGISHKSAPIGTREKLEFSQDESEFLLRQMVERGIAKGAVIISTCLRSEIYAESDKAASLINIVLDFKKLGGNFIRYFYVKQNQEAVSHLFNLTSGLDSQAVGENEIIHQVKESYILALKQGFTTNLLRKSFERSFFVGKMVRSKTEISKVDPSVAFQAVRKAKELSAGLENKRIAIIGAGIIAGHIISECAKQKAKCILVANRTFENARKLALGFGARAVGFKEFYESIDNIDILFSATKSKHLILNKDSFLFKKDSSQRLIIFDLAFPRDIDPGIADYKGVELFDLDDFNSVSLVRRSQLLLAKELITEKVARFLERKDLYGRYIAGRNPAESFGY